MDGISATDLLRMGREHHRAGRVEAAEAIYRRAVEQDRTDLNTRLNLGIVLQELGRLSEATEVLSQLVVEHPRYAAGWVHLARAIAPQGYAWEAHDAITRALKRKPDAQTLVAVSMLQLTYLQDSEAAESTCRRALKMMPANVSAWIQLGQILAVDGRRPEAAAAYQRALANEPGNAVAAFFLAALGAGVAAPPGTAMTGAPQEYVRALFDGCADRFDTLLVGELKYRTPQMLDRVFSQWLAQSGNQTINPMTMLDAGCGTGLCGLWMAKYRGRLIGADLSRRMLAETKARGVYDELVPGDVVEELEKRSGNLDLIVAADVMVYFGDLARVFAAAAAALGPGGIFLLSVETTGDADYLLRPTQRFAHSLDYLHRLASANGLALRVTEEAVLRLEQGADVPGYLVLLEKSP